MADVLSFDPATEFELIEDIDFDEEIQRPEELRFYTLDEQLLDYFDKVLPQKKHITKFEYQRIADEVERIRDVYAKTITMTDTDYQVDLARKEVSVPWVLPIYEPFELTAYSFEQNWMPLFARAARTQPNFYPRMLAALPRPFRTTASSGVPLGRSGVVVDDEGAHAVHARGPFVRTKGVIHEDGSFTIANIPVGNTADDIRVRGFFMRPRELEVPSPMPGHPFLESNREGKVITEEPLNEVFPTVDAILAHGVPRTDDPYTEGLRYLKVYDVALENIPWNTWRDRFPPALAVSQMPPQAKLSFPRSADQVAPAQSLRDAYVFPWAIGIEPRAWLMRQEDAGAYVIQMMMSKAGDAGRVPPQAPGEITDVPFPKSTPDDCFADASFDAFINSGVFRNPGICVPAAYVARERVAAKFRAKQAWTDSTEFDILKQHQALLKRMQPRPPRSAAAKYETFLARPDSEMAKQVRAVLDDRERMAEDKAQAVEKIVRELHPTNRVFTDDGGSLVVCEHTLATLRGDLARDRLEFYTAWTTIDEGFRACKFCGERINADVLVAQDDFDDSGHVVTTHEVLPTAVFQGESHVASFTNSLRDLQKIFNLDNTGESVLYILLSALQVLPQDSQVMPILDNVRALTSVVRANKKIAKTDKDRIEGLLGVAAAVVLVQTHVPFLIPRRAFGSKVLRMNGYPRDTADPADSPVLDTIIAVMKSTFESTPAALKGPITAIVRAILENSKKVRAESVIYLKQAAAKFQTQLDTARERYVEPAATGVPNAIQLPAIPVSKPEFAPSERLGAEATAVCASMRPMSLVLPKLPPNIVQAPLELWKSIAPSPDAEYIQTALESIEYADVDLKDMRRRVALGVPRGIKMDKVDAFLKRNTDATAFLTFMSRTLDVLSREDFPKSVVAKYRAVVAFLDPHMEPSLMRDAARGFLYELLHEVASSSNAIGLVQALHVATQRDLVMNMILITQEDAQRQDGELRAREREVFKQRMRQMNDTEREVTKMLLDIGIAPYIISNEDRELFAHQYRIPDPEAQDPEAEYAAAETEADGDRPEEGFGTPFDVVDNGDDPLTDDGRALPFDRGDYGERMERRYDEYDAISAFNYDEGDGI